MKRLSEMNVVMGVCIAIAMGVVACGPADVDRRQHELALAPSWVAQLDLPGCDAVHDVIIRARSLHLLRHPHHGRLVIAVVADTPTCVDEEQALRHLLEASSTKKTSEQKKLEVDSTPPDDTGDPDDDPIPIWPEEDPSRDNNSEQEP